MLECVVNVSEGRDQPAIDALARAAGPAVLDVHTDPHHNRTVLTLVGETAPRQLAQVAAERLDIASHQGAHPRFGVVDVVPFVPLAGSTMANASHARERFARWIADELGVPAFLYGPERSLPDVRRRAFHDLMPEHGPPTPHPRAGAVAVGARPPLVAWNLYLSKPDLAEAKRIAAAVRNRHVRALGLQVGDEVQVSMNLVSPEQTGPAEAWDLVTAHAQVDRAELVGLIPQAVLERTPKSRWAQLDLGAHRTIEARLRHAGLDGAPSTV